MSEESGSKKPWLPSWARRGLMGVSGFLKNTAGSIETCAVDASTVPPAIKYKEDPAASGSSRVSRRRPVPPVEGKPVGKNPMSLDSGPPQDRPLPSPLGRRSTPNRDRQNAEDVATIKRIAYVTDIEGNWECAAPAAHAWPPPPCAPMPSPPPRHKRRSHLQR